MSTQKRKKNKERTQRAWINISRRATTLAAAQYSHKQQPFFLSSPFSLLHTPSTPINFIHPHNIMTQTTFGKVLNVLADPRFRRLMTTPPDAKSQQTKDEMIGFLNYLAMFYTFSYVTENSILPRVPRYHYNHTCFQHFISLFSSLCTLTYPTLFRTCAYPLSVRILTYTICLFLIT